MTPLHFLIKHNSFPREMLIDTIPVENEDNDEDEDDDDKKEKTVTIKKLPIKKILQKAKVFLKFYLNAYLFILKLFLFIASNIYNTVLII